jgi:hypothetical protein
MFETALRLIQTEELKKALTPQAAGQQPVQTQLASSQISLQLPKLQSFPTPLQSFLLNQNDSQVVWALAVPPHQFAVARKLSLDPYFMGDRIDWRIDGYEVYQSGIQWQIGYLDAPASILKKAYDHMDFQAKNNDPNPEAHGYEIFCDGYLASLKDESLVDQLILQGAL